MELLVELNGIFKLGWNSEQLNVTHFFTFFFSFGEG